MQTSLCKRFNALYNKEMRELLPEISVILGLVVVMTGLYYLGPGNYPRLAVIAYIMAAGLVAFMPFISSFRLGREWNSNTIYLAMSLPVKGGTILGAKLLALLSQYLINSTALVLTGLLLVLPQLDIQQWLDMASNYDLMARGAGSLLLAYLLSLAGLSYVISLSFFSQLAGKLVPRFSGACTVLVFVGTFWLSSRLMSLIMVQPGSQLQIDSSLEMIKLVNGFLAVNSLVLTAFALLIFWLSAIVYNRRIEL